MANFHSYLYTDIEIFSYQGSHTWTKPSDIDESKPILVHVWGSGGGGCARYHYSPTTSKGAGGGGLAVKLIDVSALGSTETVTCGLGSNVSTARGGSSSFGSHCSATGGNGGAYSTANEGSSADYGVGGMGVGGDINKRGGQGGGGYFSTNSNSGGGGGGSAPAPYGVSNGFTGGNASTYAGGGGAGIGGNGTNGSYVGGNGGGSLNSCQLSQSPSSYYSQAAGAGGLFGAGSSPGCNRLHYTTYGGAVAQEPENARGGSILTPNQILFGGGAGVGGITFTSSGNNHAHATCGGPGAGGGGTGHNAAANYVYVSPGSGGVLGGGGGAAGSGYTCADGGNAGGSGGGGYNPHRAPKGGDGLVIIQYARLH